MFIRCSRKVLLWSYLTSAAWRALSQRFKYGSLCYRRVRSVPTCMPCSQSSLINTFSSSWLMPSTLLGTLHMRDFGTGIADKAEEEAPLNWEKRQELLCTHQNGHVLTVHSERCSSLQCDEILLMSWTLVTTPACATELWLIQFREILNGRRPAF